MHTSIEKGIWSVRRQLRLQAALLAAGALTCSGLFK